jgi:hypothetical protein
MVLGTKDMMTGFYTVHTEFKFNVGCTNKMHNTTRGGSSDLQLVGEMVKKPPCFRSYFEDLVM